MNCESRMCFQYSWHQAQRPLTWWCADEHMFGAVQSSAPLQEQSLY